MSSRSAFTRRDFLKASAGLTFVFAVPVAARVDAMVPGIGEGLSTAWVHVAPDDTITIFAPASEMGQGATTAQALILAEELDADWDKVQIESSPVDDEQYANPIFFAYGIMLTAASVSIPAYYESLRLNGAQARRVLLQAAASRWNVAENALITRPSVVLHPASGRRLSYGEIAAFAKRPADLPGVTLNDLKDPSEFRLIGHDVMRRDVPSKVDATARYSIDIALPNMLYATVLHAPVKGAIPVRVDSSATKNIRDLLRIIELPHAVAVVGRTYAAALAAERGLRVRWSKVGAVDDFNDAQGLVAHAAAARDLHKAGTIVHNEGDVELALAAAAKTHRAEYKTDFLYHAQLEPLNSVAWVKDDGRRVEIWAGSQTPTHLVRTVAATLKLPAENVLLHRTLLGGAFGNRLEQGHRYVVDSVLLSRELGLPVKVIWSRESDVRYGRYKPMTAHLLTAGEDSAGRLIAWRHRIASDEALAQSDPYRYASGKGYPATSAAGSRPSYNIANLRAEVLRQDTGVRLSPMRGVGATPNAFAAESFIDEIALRNAADPIELRLELLREQPLAQQVLRRVSQMAGWPAEGLGVSFVEVFGTQLATIVALDVKRSTGEIRVQHVWAAVDVGIAVQPGNVATQIAGGIVYGLSNALKERITFVNGAVEQSNFHDYPVLRMGEVPHIDCEVIQSTRAPTGSGEAGTIGIMPALANAIAARTGQRLRHLPFTPERVRAALSS